LGGVVESASIGANAIILFGISIGKHAMIGSGAVVAKDVPPYALAAENPSRIISEVDKDENRIK